MIEKPLTEEQALQVARAMVTLRPQVDGYRSKFFLEKLTVATLQGELGYFVDFRYEHKEEWASDWTIDHFRLFIGYYNVEGNFFNSTLSLGKYGKVTEEGPEEVLTLELVKNVAKATDLLRNFKIWEPSNRDFNS